MDMLTRLLSPRGIVVAAATEFGVIGLLLLARHGDALAAALVGGAR